MSKKQGRKYIDRNETINLKKKLPNVSPGVIAIKCSSERYSIEKRFDYKLVNPEDNAMCEVLVLPTNVCVVIPPKMSFESDPTIAVKSHISIPTDQFSGKFKKGAEIIFAGSKLFEILQPKGEVKSFHTPVGGQLLEIHSSFQSTIDLATYNNMEYICIIVPNTAIPSIHGPKDYVALCEDIERKRTDQSCFSFQSTGKCSRGDTCKFSHILSQNIDSVNKENGASSMEPMDVLAASEDNGNETAKRQRI